MSHQPERGLRDLSPRQRKALEDCVSATEELIELDYEPAADDLEPAEQEEEQ